MTKTKTKTKTQSAYPPLSPALERGTVAIPRPANELDGRHAADADPAAFKPKGRTS